MTYGFRDQLKEGGKLLGLCNREEFLKFTLDKSQRASTSKRSKPYDQSLLKRVSCLKHQRRKSIQEALAPKESVEQRKLRMRKESVLVETTDPRLLELEALSDSDEESSQEDPIERPCYGGTERRREVFEAVC